MVNLQRLESCYQQARDTLLEARHQAGHWEGELSASALSTATAISALSLVRSHAPLEDRRGVLDPERLDELIDRGTRYLLSQQNEDGGWGDTTLSYSNIATSMLAVSALTLAGCEKEHRSQLEAAEEYLESEGRVEGLKQRFGEDKTFAIPILTNAALAGLADWRDVSPLPFELACVPQALFRLVRMPVVSYAIPALVAIGQARYFHRSPRNPFTWLVRRLALRRSRRLLRRMQPESGGYLEATPLTSFVVMSLASIGQVTSKTTQCGVQFLVDSAREDGSWPIDTNLATWNTSLALKALDNGGEDLSQLDCLDWLLGCQHDRRHPFTGASPGGWGWSNLSGAVPDCDDTPGALLAIAAWRRGAGCDENSRERIDRAATAGLRWILSLQNRDGGWPTFCRGWGKLPFDRSGTDLSAHVLRAIRAWWNDLDRLGLNPAHFQAAVDRGFSYLQQQQQADGSWLPLWFGNQDNPDDENPVFGTARVLPAYLAWDREEDQEAQRGLDWLAGKINPDGGWGGGPAVVNISGQPTVSTVEETALAVETLSGTCFEGQYQEILYRGIEWLQDAVESGRFRQSAPIGFYFAKLWYHERLYPVIFTVAALGQVVSQLPSGDSAVTVAEPCS
ncbi:MAG: prenyltransferase/squalene oxidase repeat-containing protein [Pirellulaceae bacterium]